MIRPRHISITCLAIAALIISACHGPHRVADSSASGTTFDRDKTFAQIDALCHAKEHAEAERVLREAIESIPASDSRADRIAVAVCRRRLAQVLTAARRFADAETEGEIAYQALNDLYQPIEEFPTGDEQLARAAWVLGEVRLLAGRPAEAEELLSGALGWFEGLDAESADTAVLLGVYGDCLTQLGRYSDAEDTTVQSYLRLVKLKGDKAPETLDALQRVIFLYQAWDRPDKVDEYLTSSGLTDSSR
jgi:tetratricopeptide (TPR) repeat protein